MLNKKYIIFIAIIIVCIIGIYYLFIKEKDYIKYDSELSVLNKIENNTNKEESKNKDIKEKITIYITGAIKNQGVYELEEKSRIVDCIEKAGGLTEDADLKNINLAYVIEDGMKIYIPKNSDNNEVKDDTNLYVYKEKNNTINSDNINLETQNNKIDINTASQTELETLPGIGPSTAAKIINYRKENGKFNNIEDIKNINGIGDSKYEQIKNLIKI